jgi:hypothetical protein
MTWAGFLPMILNTQYLAASTPTTITFASQCMYIPGTFRISSDCRAVAIGIFHLLILSRGCGWVGNAFGGATGGGDGTGEGKST